MQKKILSVVLSASMALVPMSSKICFAEDSSCRKDLEMAYKNLTDYKRKSDECLEKAKSDAYVINTLVAQISNQEEIIEIAKKLIESNQNLISNQKEIIANAQNIISNQQEMIEHSANVISIQKNGPNKMRSLVKDLVMASFVYFGNKFFRDSVGIVFDDGFVGDLLGMAITMVLSLYSTSFGDKLCTFFGI